MKKKSAKPVKKKNGGKKAAAPEKEEEKAGEPKRAEGGQAQSGKGDGRGKPMKAEEERAQRENTLQPGAPGKGAGQEAGEEKREKGVEAAREGGEGLISRIFGKKKGRGEEAEAKGRENAPVNPAGKEGGKKAEEKAGEGGGPADEEREGKAEAEGKTADEGQDKKKEDAEPGEEKGEGAGGQAVPGAGAEKEVDKPYMLSDGVVEAQVRVTRREGVGVPIYNLEVPKLEGGTRVFVEDIKPELLKKIKISTQEAVDIKMARQLKERFMALSKQMMKNNMPHLSPESQEFIAGTIAREMLGLGDIEFLLRDDFIEEVCINGSKEPVWVYHKKYGWMRSSLVLPGEMQIWNYSSAIARGVGRQINTHTPLLDAYLPTGDRVNATLMPISSSGNTITIRKFARKPWTITDYIRMETVPSEVAAILWLATQYEANIIISGGTGTGKTSLLNILSVFIPQNQRVVSIEQTKEITLPSYLQWVPMIVREPTSEGTGSVSMLDLMVNSLRMRPDRIMVGEIRRAEEAQVLFEAMHTGHSVYATLHAETVEETLRRLTNPPINIPPVMAESLHLIVTSYRDRRSGTRKIFEVGEILSSEKGVKTHNIYEWKPDQKAKVGIEKSQRLLGTLQTYTNMSIKDIKKNLAEKEEILNWMAEKNINEVDKVGEIVSRHYNDPEGLMKMVRKNG